MFLEEGTVVGGADGLQLKISACFGHLRPWRSFRRLSHPRAISELASEPRNANSNGLHVAPSDFTTDTHLVNRPPSSGHTATPILVFFGIVTLSVIFFFVFTLPRGRKAPVLPAPKAPVATTSPSVAPPPEQVTPVTPVTPPAPPPPPPAKPLYIKSQDLLTAISSAIAGDKPEDAEKCFDPAIPAARREFFSHLFTKTKLRPSAQDPWKEIGRISGSERWELALERRTQALEISPATPTPIAPAPALAPGTPAPLPPIATGLDTPSPTVPINDLPPAPQQPAAAPKSLSMSLDVKLLREDGWQVTNLRFPPALVADVRADLEAQGIHVSVDQVAQSPDPLGTSHGFLTQLLQRKFGEARGLTDQQKVTREKLAGLCIVFEEGEFTLAPQNALNVTAVNADRAWAIVRVQSEKEKAHSEFGIEMSNDPVRGWKVDALDLNRLLDTHVRATNVDAKVPYKPLVDSPSGGESLAVYFEYDKSDLTPRAARQLEIVAGLLKSDPARKLQISGFADALGPENYNYKLSQRRADTVRTKLNQLGVNPAQIVSQGFGETKPLAPNQKDDGTDDPEGRSINRRTEIYLDF